ncbi:MAG TPA: FAD-dependent oxidoreductase [Verrucomicrobiae bacterium]|nr:FAD-dependent oxidoreductase [Verrucomicrobiae bacterium]
MNTDFDIAIVGSGFSGSLMAMIMRRLGRSVVLLERGRHPRFVIGESSTPLANLLIEEIAAKYDLPRLRSLSKWGAWQREFPKIACGLKRGFTFLHHSLDQPFQHCAGHRDQLLVAASPNNEVSDTHWYRPDFDHHLVREAQALGAGYLDETKLSAVTFDADGARLAGQRLGKEVSLRAKFVIDATGPRGCLHHLLGLPEKAPPHLPPTQALFTHFSDVRRWDSLHASTNGTPPYPLDDAALHHVFDGGWIWMLRFNNGITSAGVACTDDCAARLGLAEGAPAWDRLLARLPSVREQFAGARPLLPFMRIPRVCFRGAAFAGPRWALLPSAAGFIDPLLSSGFPLTLLGITRLAGILVDAWEQPELEARLAEYGRVIDQELDVTERLVAALYASMRNFEVFVPLTLLYFAAASYSETVRRLGHPEKARGFLLNRDPQFGPGLRAACELVPPALQSPAALSRLQELILATIAPFDVAGLAKPNPANWYPVDLKDLFAAAPKLGVGRAEIQAMLVRSGLA